MQTDNRPLSPHLQVYRMTDFTSLMSILHRITGVCTLISLFILTGWLMMAAGGVDSYASANHFLANPFIVLVMFMGSGALIYHFCNGIRHLLWDFGYNLELHQARKSGRIVAISAISVNLIFWIILSFSL
ncbi:succinate dehydrogenase, cytochrome b556 subunit [Rappaport israeli]|uniref:succinate dehydrogenase, cytochrome b556 subunit n=1 Tax=Rappaport israeli TaxID=1839807 RepID=UPI000930FEEC|nr:succinate dehydrogenase, cytochrome b556 subunit [Rappaport israeli]